MKQNKQYMKGLAVLMCGILFYGGVTAQETTQKVARDYNLDFDYIYRQDGWASSSNAAGLRMTPVEAISYAEAYVSKQDGDFKNYHESNDAFDFGAKTESFRTIKGVSYYGKMQYEYFQGRNMMGSMLTRPGENPYDIIEFTPGRKNKERYIISGGIGFGLACNLDGGIKIDYEAENYAKRKDLRHSNTLMDLDISGGLLYHLGAKASIGANYLYRKTTEKLQAKQISQKGEAYTAFYNKGLWFGESGLWTSSNLRLVNNTLNGITGLPITNREDGIALQVSIGKENRAVNFFGEFSYRNRTGKTGEKGVTFTEDNTDIFDAFVMFKVRQSDNMHFFRGRIKYADLQNNEFVLGKETVSGVTNVVTYGKTTIFTQRSINLNAEYEFAMRATGYYPVLSLRAGLNYNNRSGISSLVFPQFRTQWLESYEAYAKADKNFKIGKGTINGNLGVSYAKGKGNKLAEYSVETLDGMSLGQYAAQNAEYRNYEFEYLTTPRLGLMVGAGYTHPVGRARIPLYAHIEWNYTHANKLIYILGSSRSLLSMRIGCKF